MSVLETVQENAADATDPSPAALQAAADLKPLTKLTDDDNPVKRSAPSDDPDKHGKLGESESESGGNKSDDRKSRQNSFSQAPRRTKTGYASLAGSKARQPESTRNMTVETETVQSIPHSGLNPGERSAPGRGDNSGSVKLKSSNETIRPKKERRQHSKKPRSVNQGTGMLQSPSLLQRRSSYRLAGSTCVSTTTSPPGTDLFMFGSPQAPPRPRAARTYSQQLVDAVSSLAHHPTTLFRHLSSDSNLSQASSKADIFEARVANAVDEANSSDSDETFVYESNPPEPRRPRHHSRTPSVTSAHSAVDARTNIRNFGEVMDERRVAGKRSMKFSNNPFNDRDSPTDRQDGSVRSHHPRHYGRFGRSVRDSSMSEQDSPFTQASKLRQNPASIRHSRPNSPRSPQTAQYRAVAPPVFGRKKDAGFELDAEGADDERTPLMGTIRAQRSARHGSRANAGGGGSSRASSIDEFYGVRSHGRCGKLGGCLLGVLVFAIVVLSTVAFLVVSNRPLTDVRIRRIDNVLASEQELMLDMLVAAVNPNALSVTVTNMDVNVFAKSRYVGNDPDHALHDGNHTDAILPRDRRRKRLRNALKPTSPNRSDRARRDGVDDGTDPPDDGDLDSDAQTMLLGRISHFDQALAFEGSPLKRHLHLSVGEVRLARPGNLTESGGSARWEHVLHHPFELIVRGVLRYRLPVSAREESAAVGASVVVMPEDGVDRRGAMRTRPVDRSERWQWIDWDEVEDKSENGSADDKDEVLS